MEGSLPEGASGAHRPAAKHHARELVDEIGGGVPRAYLFRLSAQSPVNGLVTIAVTVLVTVLLLSEGYSVGVAVWSILQLSLASVVLLRWWKNFAAKPPPLDFGRSRRGLHRALLWATLSAGLWAALTLFLPSAPPHVQVALVLVMGGMAAGASATLAAVPLVAAVYILVCTVPATLYYLALGDTPNRTLALTFCAFAAAMIAMSRVVFSALARQFNAEWHARELEQMGAALRESEQRFRATFQNAAVGIAHIGMDGSWLRVNDRVCEILGYGREELMSKKFQDLTLPADLARNLERFRDMQRGATDGYQMEKRYLRKDGSVIWCQLTTALQRDDDRQPLFSISVIQDITARKQAEQALRDSDQAKDEFLAVLGHELRNPLAPLRTSLDILEQAPPSPELFESLLPMMNRQLSHLVRLVDDLLDISRISRGAIELQRDPLDLAVPIQAAIEQAKPLIELRQHQLVLHEPDESPRVNGDVERLTQVFANLLDNAAKYMAPGGTIELTITTANDQATVLVRDEGYGIPPERLDSLFKLFSQIPEHREDAAGGLGIGLSLARRIVEMHGGSIEASSEGLGRGSEFVVRLPERREAIRHGPVRRVDSSAGPAFHVLVVDDNVDAAEGLRQLLEMHGHTVETAYDGAAALARLEASPPDVLLLDLGLPGIDGLEVARQARARPGGSEMLLAAVTGWGQDEDRHRTAQAGFDLHLTKPLDWAQLASILRERATTRETVT